MSYDLKNAVIDALKLRLEILPVEASEARLKICIECPALTPKKRCSDCGCYMPVKTKLTRASCPRKKW